MRVRRADQAPAKCGMSDAGVSRFSRDHFTRFDCLDAIAANKYANLEVLIVRRNLVCDWTKVFPGLRGFWSQYLLLSGRNLISSV